MVLLVLSYIMEFLYKTRHEVTSVFNIHVRRCVVEVRDAVKRFRSLASTS